MTFPSFFPEKMELIESKKFLLILESSSFASYFEKERGNSLLFVIFSLENQTKIIHYQLIFILSLEKKDL